jgi:integrase
LVTGVTIERARVWRRVRDDAGNEGLVSHTLRKTVASFLDGAAVPTRKISDQLRRSKVSMTQDRYLGASATTADRRRPRNIDGVQRRVSRKPSQKRPRILIGAPG